MAILKYFSYGLKTANKKWKMVVYLWFMNFMFALLMVTPFYFLFQKDFSRSLMGDQMARGFDLLWFGDLIYRYKDFYASLLGWLLLPAIFFLLLFVFLNGGIMGRIVAEEESLNLTRFFADCGKYFFRFFRVFLISLIGYLIVFGLFFRAISFLFQLWTKNAASEWPLIFAANLKFLVMILLFSIVRMFFDYVRVRLVVEESKKAIRATILSFSFVGKRFLKAWILYLLVGLVALILGLIYLVVSQIFPSTGPLWVVLFIWQQIYILSKMWTRVLFFSTEYHFYKT